MPDALDLVEAAYQDAPDEHTWLMNLVAAAGVADRGMGVGGATYCMGPDGLAFFGMVGAIAPAFLNQERRERVVDSLESAVGRASMARAFPRAPRAGGFDELLGIHGMWKAMIGSMDPEWTRGKVDVFAILAGDPSGYGCLVGGVSSVPVKTLPREAHLLTQVAVHVAHGYRLHRERDLARVDAILDPDGRMQHLEPAHVSPADGAALTSATRRVDRARGKLRRADPEEALSLWRGLVDGRWTLVDHADHDGRRYVFARRNAPTVHAWDSLSEKEKQVVVYAVNGHSQKLIAYELGLGASTVGRHLAAAARKVGVASRVQLLSAWKRDHGEGIRGHVEETQRGPVTGGSP